MTENSKKLSLLTNLNNILYNNFVNTHVFIYNFYSMDTLIVNDVSYNVSDKNVKIVLYLDELLIEICGTEEYKNISLPYQMVNELYILLEE